MGPAGKYRATGRTTRSTIIWAIPIPVARTDVWTERTSPDRIRANRTIIASDGLCPALLLAGGEFQSSISEFSKLVYTSSLYKEKCYVIFTISRLSGFVLAIFGEIDDGSRADGG